MSNMSYCRFENTLEALYDCHEAMFDEEAIEDISESEKQALTQLKELVLEMAEDFYE